MKTSIENNLPVLQTLWYNQTFCKVGVRDRLQYHRTDTLLKTLPVNCIIALTMPDVLLGWRHLLQLCFTDHIYHTRNNVSIHQRKVYVCTSHIHDGGLKMLMVTWGHLCISECFRRQGNIIDVECNTNMKRRQLFFLLIQII